MPILPASFSPGDASLLSLFSERSEDMKAVLCLLAQMGVRWRRMESALCSDWVQLLEPHPFYKGGQVLFDLLEFEDFMLDGAAAAVPHERLRAQIDRIMTALNVTPPDFSVPEDLPDLETGFYLYRDVVLGVLSLARQMEGAEQS